VISGRIKKLLNFQAADLTIIGTGGLVNYHDLCKSPATVAAEHLEALRDDHTSFAVRVQPG
jgi:hypothetical protein